MVTAAATLALALMVPVLPQADAAAAGAPPAAAEEPQTAPAPRLRQAPSEPRNAVSFQWENDVVGGTDRGYSNGVSLTVSREGRGPLGWVWRPLARDGGGRWFSTYEVTQVLTTPTDKSRAVPDPTDVPYAGLLYGAVSTQYAHADRLDALKVVAGVMGPGSMAGRTQTWFHDLIGSPVAQGWDHQLPNTAIVNVTYDHRRRVRLTDGDRRLGLDAIPALEGSAGNALVEAGAGVRLRVGDLPDDFGPTQLRGMAAMPMPRLDRGASSRAVHVYAFVGATATAVARNIVLDDATEVGGLRLDKRNAVGVFEAGVVVWTRRLEAAFTFVQRGREYEAQAEPSRFGALVLAVRF